MDYRPGERVELIHSTDELTDLEPGARGTVIGVDDMGTVRVAWDCGSRLGLVPGVDACWWVGAPNALELCNCCDVNRMDPASPAGYCRECEAAARAGDECWHAA